MSLAAPNAKVGCRANGQWCRSGKRISCYFMIIILICLITQRGAGSRVRGWKITTVTPFPAQLEHSDAASRSEGSHIKSAPELNRLYSNNKNNNNILIVASSFGCNDFWVWRLMTHMACLVRFHNPT